MLSRFASLEAPPRDGGQQRSVLLMLGCFRVLSIPQSTNPEQHTLHQGRIRPGGHGRVHVHLALAAWGSGAGLALSLGKRVSPPF